MENNIEFKNTVELNQKETSKDFNQLSNFNI